MNASLTMKIALAASLVASIARADKDENDSAPVTRTAPARAFEIHSGSAYTQGFGRISRESGTHVDDLASGALVGQLGLGYRLDPRLMLGVYGEFGRYGRGDAISGSGSVYGAAAGLQAQYHLLPFDVADPWIGLGTGWRGFWIDDQDRTDRALHGWDVLRVQVGVDCHAAEWLTLVPTVGATATMFLTESVADRSFASVPDPRLNAFVFAGLGGRFDIGDRVTREQVTVAGR
jgi:hypothetical protein